MDTTTTLKTEAQRKAMPVTCWGREAAKVAANTQTTTDADDMSALFALAMAAQ